MSHLKSREIVVPRTLNDSTVITVLSLMESKGSEAGVSLEVHGQLHCFERVELQVVKTAPYSQLFKLQSVNRLVTVLNEADKCGVVCKCQEIDRGVFKCAVIGVQGKEQWGDNTALRSSNADCTGAG